MKKIITLMILFAGLLSFAQSPRDGKMRDKIKAQKVAFITEKLELTTDEAEKFWPIYNAFEATTDNIRSKDLRDVKQSIRRNPDMSDAEADKVLDKLLKAENNMHKAKVKLISDLKGVISAKKIIRLKRAEDEFNRALLKKLRDRRKRN